MKLWHRILIALVVIVAAVFFFKLLIGNHTVALFSPQGSVAAGELNVIRNSVLLMLIIIIPVLIAFYAIAWKYRSTNPDAKHEPEHSAKSAWSELLWWALPTAIVICLGIVGWQGAHSLDPAEAIVSANAPINVEVIALPWKWLFIYPAQNIATVNYLEFPENTPLHFDLTADGPISSFWIPQLGSQIYAMAAMQTQLNLIASTTGEFTGKDTEINGAGYAGMTFTAQSVTQSDFANWVANTKLSSEVLDQPTYDQLMQTSTYVQPIYYSSVESGLYDDTMMKYMMPMSNTPNE